MQILGRFLSRREVSLAAPSRAGSVKPGESVEFRAVVASSLPGAPPADVELVLAAGTPAERRVPMARTGEVYTAEAAPFPADPGPVLLPVEVMYADGSIRGVVQDLELAEKAGGVKLSRIRNLRLAPKREVLLTDGRRLPDAPEPPKSLELKVGGQALSLDLAQAREIAVAETASAEAVNCTIVASLGGEQLGRLDAPLFLDGAPRPNFDAIRDRRFIQPPRSAAPISYFRIESSPGEPIGEGKSYAYAREDLSFPNSQGVVLNCQVGEFGGGWSLSLSGPGNQPLKVGEYQDARRQAFAAEAPGIELNGNGRGSNTLVGAFRIWELEVKGDKVVRLAVDFMQRSEGSTAPLAGMLRYNSNFH